MENSKEFLKAVGQNLVIFNEVLGQGSYGIVYTGKFIKSKDQSFLVAVKIIKKQKLNEMKETNFEEY
jgi:serine/threonine protein kinase